MTVSSITGTFSRVPLRNKGDPSYPLFRWHTVQSVVGDASGGSAYCSFVPSEENARRYLWSFDTIHMSYSGGGTILDLVLYMGHQTGSFVNVFERAVDTIVPTGGVSGYIRGDYDPKLPKHLIINPDRIGESLFDLTVIRQLNPGAPVIIAFWASGLCWEKAALETPTGPRFP